MDNIIYLRHGTGSVATLSSISDVVSHSVEIEEGVSDVVCFRFHERRHLP